MSITEGTATSGRERFRLVVDDTPTRAQADEQERHVYATVADALETALERMHPRHPERPGIVAMLHDFRKVGGDTTATLSAIG